MFGLWQESILDYTELWNEIQFFFFGSALVVYCCEIALLPRSLSSSAVDECNSPLHLWQCLTVKFICCNLYIAVNLSVDPLAIYVEPIWLNNQKHTNFPIRIPCPQNEVHSTLIKFLHDEISLRFNMYLGSWPNFALLAHSAVGFVRTGGLEKDSSCSLLLKGSGDRGVVGWCCAVSTAATAERSDRI